jgi:hypothetical protein
MGWLATFLSGHVLEIPWFVLHMGGAGHGLCWFWAGLSWASLALGLFGHWLRWPRSGTAMERDDHSWVVYELVCTWAGLATCWPPHGLAGYGLRC